MDNSPYTPPREFAEASQIGPRRWGLILHVAIVSLVWISVALYSGISLSRSKGDKLQIDWEFYALFAPAAFVIILLALRKNRIGITLCALGSSFPAILGTRITIGSLRVIWDPADETHTLADNILSALPIVFCGVLFVSVFLHSWWIVGGWLLRAARG